MRLRTIVVTAILLALMATTGLGTYRLLGHFKKAEALRAPAQDPITLHVGVTLPGTIYVAQSGDIYSLHGGAFTRLAAHTDAGVWTMPSLTPDGRLLAVLRGAHSSDVYLLDRATGAVIGRLTSDDAGKRTDGSLEYNHWAFYPRASVDGGAVIFSYDSPKCGYNTGLAIWSISLPSPGATITPPPPPHTFSGCPQTSSLPTGTRLTTPNQYTGGDVMPLTLADGGVVFVRYSFDDHFHIQSTLWYQRGPTDDGVPLTRPEDDCSQPALAADGTTLAMVCTHGEQTADLELTTLRLGGGTGSPSATAGGPAAPTGARSSPSAEAASTGPTTVGRAGLFAFPTWAPDGSGLVYLAPAQSGGGFQLWWLAGAPGSPQPPQPLTDQLGLDATSAIAWSAS